MSGESQPSQDPIYETKEGIGRLAKFREWLLSKEGEKESCTCRTSLTNPSWASSAHEIVIHVCEEHAKKFGIPKGPVWSDEWRRA